MKPRKRERQSFDWKMRVFFGVVALMLLSLGVGSLLRKQLVYRNFWDGPVFAPYAILLGVLVMAVAIFQGRGR